MVTIRLAELMHERQVRYLAQVVEGTGLSRPALTNLYYNKATRIEFDTIDKLCAFFDCQPGDLLHRA
jgi:putative transcriptional regulator